MTTQLKTRKVKANKLSLAAAAILSVHMYTAFTKTLLRWHHLENDRVLPWKSETDPYKIWLSEIILQQTRAEQGLPYYNRFIARFPTVQQLASAEEDEVFRLWQGLGYYNRCRNMIATAKQVTANGGHFPDTLNGLLSLKGIGPYTAAAIASFGFGLAHAVLDGNVFRVLSRFFGISTPIDSTEGKKQFTTLAQQLISPKEPAAYNQAIMDFGSVICSPKAPQCGTCPLASGCVAYKTERVSLLPVKAKRTKVSERYFHYLVLQYKDQLFIRQRQHADIWQGLYEFPLIEHKSATLSAKHWQPFHLGLKPRLVDEGKQRLTHQIIHSFFYVATLKERPLGLENGKWISKNLIKNYAFPKTIISFLLRKKYF